MCIFCMYEFVFVCMCMCTCVCVCVCVCVHLLSPINKLDTKKFGVMLTLDSCNEQALHSIIFINTKNNKFYFPFFFSPSTRMAFHSLHYATSLYYKHFPQHYSPVILLKIHKCCQKLPIKPKEHTQTLKLTV